MRDASFAAILAARAAGTLVSYDTNLRLALWPIEQARATIAAALALSDIVFPSEDEALSIWGLGDADAVLDHLLAFGAGIVALKRGDRGAVVATPNMRAEIPPAPCMPVELDRRGRRLRRRLPRPISRDRRPLRGGTLCREGRGRHRFGLWRRRADPAPGRAPVGRLAGRAGQCGGVGRAGGEIARGGASRRPASTGQRRAEMQMQARRAASPPQMQSAYRRSAASRVSSTGLPAAVGSTIAISDIWAMRSVPTPIRPSRSGMPSSARSAMIQS